MFDAHFAGATIVAVTVALVVLVGLIQALRLLRLKMLHSTLRRAIDAGVPISMASLDRALGHRPPAERARSDLRNGLLLLVLALACLGFGLIQGDAATWRLALGIAIFPLLIGLFLTWWGARMLRRHGG